MSIVKKIKSYNKNKKHLFTTPSHAQGDYINPMAKKMLGEKFFQSDFSEIDGFDNLRNPIGIIKKLQDKFAQIYNTQATFMLLNGSTSGIIAAIMATVKENEKILVARNCHISVYNALALSGAKPIWFLPEYESGWGIYKGVKASEINEQLNIHKDIKAIVITSPTYEGMHSKIKEISQLCKKKNITLIVDEAHGALLQFTDLNALPAIKQGADISIQSLHKTAGAPNPCALLHLNKDSAITQEQIQNSLNLINTTSPSYPLMCAIETTVNFLNSNKGKKHIEKLKCNIDIFKTRLDKGVKVYNENNDKTKLLIKIENISTKEAVKILNNKFNIEEEFCNENAILYITGVGTTDKKLKLLSTALNQININAKKKKSCKKPNEYILPTMSYTPREAMQKKQKIINTADATNKISAEAIVAYPPGIPIILPGEIINTDILKNIAQESISICQ